MSMGKYLVQKFFLTISKSLVYPNLPYAAMSIFVLSLTSGLFHDNQMNWAALTKKPIKSMSVKKLAYYLEDSSITL